MSELRVPEARAGTARDGTAWFTEGRGSPLVFVHGVGMNRAVWQPQVQAFARDHQVVTHDLLGHGESPLPSAQPSLAEFSDQLAGLLDELGLDRVVLVGHSLGALVALDFALRWPRRVERLVALNTVHGRSPEQQQAVDERASRLRMNGVTDTMNETLARWFGPEAVDAGRDDVEQVREWLLNVDREGYARAYGVFASADRELAGRIAALEPPALFLTGARDPHSTPEMSGQLAAAVRHGEARVLPGERHMMAWESPEPTNRAIADFIAGASADSMATGTARSEMGG